MSEEVIRYVGVGIEESFATEATSSMHVDIADASLDTPDEQEMVFEGGLTRGNLVKRPGSYVPEGDITYAMDVNSIGYLLYLALGYGEEVDADTNTHKYNFNADPIDRLLPTGTFYVAKDKFIHKFVGGAVDELSIAVDSEFAEVTASVVAKKDSDGGPPESDITNLELPDAYPLAFHEVSVEVGDKGDTLESKVVESVDLTISNNIDTEQGISLGSRYMQKVIAGDLGVSADLEIAFSSKEQLEDFWGSASGPGADGSQEKQISITFDSGTHGKLVIDIPRAYYESVSLEPSGTDRLIQTVSLTSLYDETAESEIIASLDNDYEYDTNYDWLVDSTSTT